MVIFMILDNNIILRNIENKILNTQSKCELANKMGVKPPTLYKILERLSTGKGVTTTTLNKIAIAAGISCQELLTE